MAKVVELVLNEEEYKDGVFAISLVEEPAIELDFVWLAKEKNYEPFKLAAVDEEKRILIGAALVPDFPILRKDKEGNEYYIKFSKETVKRTSELYLNKGNQNNTTLDHAITINGVGVTESWIKEDEEKDKSNIYGIEAPVGTWFVAMKVENGEIWNEYIKTGKVKGFSIEGLFDDKLKVEAQKLQKKTIEERINESEIPNAVFAAIISDFVDYILDDKDEN